MHGIRLSLMKVTTGSLLGLFVAVVPVFAQSDPFTAFLISARTPEEIARRSQEGDFDPVKNVKVLYLNKTVSIVVGVHNPAMGEGNAPKVAFDVKLLKPDQTVVVDRPAFTMARRVVNNYALGEDMFDLTLGDTDPYGPDAEPEGERLLVVVAKDMISGKEANVEEVLMYKKEDKEARGFASLNDFGSFMTFYYQKKDSSLVIPALEYLLQQEAFLRDRSHLKPVQHFFAALGHGSLALLAEIKLLQPKYEGNAAAALAEIIQDSIDFVSPEPLTAKDLDYLWSEFMATGDDAPVKKIISVLSLDAQGEMQLTVGAAEWSLGANGAQHQKVYDAIKAESTGATGLAKERLSRIMQKIEAQR